MCDLLKLDFTITSYNYEMTIHANYIPSNSVSGVRSYTPSMDSWTICLTAEM